MSQDELKKQTTFSGNSVEAAARSASAQLGVPYDQLNLRLVETQPGEVTLSADPEACDPHSLYSEERDALTKLAQELLASLARDADVSCELAPFVLTVKLDGESVSILQSNQGEALNDLQFLFGRFHRAVFPESPYEVRVDANGFRKNREDVLLATAQEAAQRLTAESDSEVIGPFNSYERRIVHLALKEDDRVETFSIGDGALKRIKIRLRNPDSTA